MGRRWHTKPTVFLACSLLLVVALVVSFVRLCPLGRTLWNYHIRIHDGLSLSEVESILGPGVQEDSPPDLRHPDGIRPALRGETFFRFYSGAGMAIWVGFQEGKVCDKWLEDTWP
jgi:hypothetical protein